MYNVTIYELQVVCYKKSFLPALYLHQIQRNCLFDILVECVFINLLVKFFY